jgi:hypothetical protein
LLYIIEQSGKNQRLTLQIFMLCCYNRGINILEYLHSKFGEPKFIVIINSYGCCSYAISEIIKFFIMNNYITDDLFKNFLYQFLGVKLMLTK